MAKPKTRVKRRDPDRVEFAKAEDLLRQNPRVVLAAIELRKALRELAKRGGVEYAVLYSAIAGIFIEPDEDWAAYWNQSPLAWKRRLTARD